MIVGNDVDGKSYRNSHIDSSRFFGFCLRLSDVALPGPVSLNDPSHRFGTDRNEGHVAIV